MQAKNLTTKSPDKVQVTGESQPDPLVASYRPVAQRIIAGATESAHAYQRLAYLTDRIGHRLSGSRQLTQAIDWAVTELKADGQTPVWTEQVMVPHWVRGAESGWITSPSLHKLHLLGLGMSVPAPEQGLEAEVVVISHFDQLKARKEEIRGKIVLYDVPLPAWDREKGSGYGDVYQYRLYGPSRAAALGARAVLLRSFTTTSLQTPHTGTLIYDEKVPKIPAAAISTEDARLIVRLIDSGHPVRVRLSLESKRHPDAPSANVLAELRGRERPEQIVLIGAHLDSWDVGAGAHDNGAGCVIVMDALRLLRRLGLTPRRTIRLILFTNEENGTAGGQAYCEAHKQELGRHAWALESDHGAFKPRGFLIHAPGPVRARLARLRPLFLPVSGAEMTESSYTGVDISCLTDAGIPGVGLLTEGEHYFEIIHSEADTLDKVEPQHLANGVAAAALMAYVLADLPD